MRSPALLLGAIASIAAAHDGHIPGAPKLFGRNAVADLKARNAFAGAPVLPRQAEHQFEERQGNTGGQCGPGFGNCAAGYCCSGAGWCGNTKDYCQAPDCQLNYGPGCDGNKVPAGASTANDARPQLGSVPYGGGGVYSCLKPGTVALTYDDGPFTYTDGMLDVLKSYNAKATFFITGNNIGKGAIDTTAQWSNVIKRMHAEGHQVASHTWSHQDLSAITAAQRKNQMVYNEMAIRNILGFYPTYMRPPYSSCTPQSGCENDMRTLGYVISYFDLDTDDYNNVTPQLIQNAKNNFQSNLTTRSPSNGDWLAIAHDIHEQTARNLTAFMLDTLTRAGWKAVTMGECMNDPPANWYRTPGGSGTTPPPSGGNPISTDGTCGNGVTCQGSTFGNCCSQYGWCGSTTDHCGTGCQSAFGTCSSGGTTPPPSGGNTVSTDGSCGNGVTCQGSAFGNCCSQYGWCGSTGDHCGAGCQSAFGTCSAPPAGGNRVSTDGSCGNGVTCQGSAFGNCCSQYGWCGSTADHCSAGCQSAFGSCS